MPIVYLGIGSNIEDRKRYIHRAIDLLKDRGIEILKVSSLIETDPVGGPPQGKFLNGAIKIKTNFSPQELLKTLKAIEQEVGRTKTVKNGPREIDLDILFYDQIKLTTETLTIPHPRIRQRNFVLEPLKEIEPSLTQKLLHENH